MSVVPRLGETSGRNGQGYGGKGGVGMEEAGGFESWTGMGGQTKGGRVLKARAWPARDAVGVVGSDAAAGDVVPYWGDAARMRHRGMASVRGGQCGVQSMSRSSVYGACCCFRSRQTAHTRPIYDTPWMAH